MIAVTGGGTGGHIFPNLSVIEELRRRGRNDFVWIGGKGGKEETWAREAGVPFHGIRAGKLRRYFSLRNAFDLLATAAGVLQSALVLLRRRPSLLFSKGGFVSVPPVVAAKTLDALGSVFNRVLPRGLKLPRVPIVTHESDVDPGLATRIIARFAACVCVSFEGTRGRLPGVRTVLTGNPIRETVRGGDRRKGLVFLGFEDGAPVVLVLGGSLGARALNRAAREMAASRALDFNLVHQCGQGNRDPGFPDGGRYRQFEFIGREMGDVLAAADLVVSRAGAGALCEIGAMRKASILVPLPKRQSRGEQIGNARLFEEKGASVVIEDGELTGERLHDAIAGLLGDRKRLLEMGEKARALSAPGAEKRIADLIEELLGEGAARVRRGDAGPEGAGPGDAG